VPLEGEATAGARAVRAAAGGLLLLGTAVALRARRTRHPISSPTSQEAAL
jgi:hypothetical protein